MGARSVISELVVDAYFILEIVFVPYKIFRQTVYVLLSLSPYLVSVNLHLIEENPCVGAGPPRAGFFNVKMKYSHRRGAESAEGAEDKVKT